MGGKMKTNFYILAFFAAGWVFSACNREELPECRTVRLSFSDTEVRTSLNAGRTALQWSEGDAVSVYNDFDGSIASAVYQSGGNMSVSVPVEATRVKATYPETEGSYDTPGFVFPAVQEQPAAGVLGGANYPLVAEAAIAGDAAVLHFEAVGSAFALNVYNPQEAGEKLQTVSVKPAQRAKAVQVRLAEPFVVGADKPSDKRTYEGQVYACLEKGQYNGIVFTVTTDRRQYSITTNETLMDLESHDFFVVNLDLAHLKAYVYFGVICEDFSQDHEPLVEVTLDGAGFIELAEVQPEDQLTEDIIPDFSTVGYACGDAPYPDYPVVESLSVAQISAWLSDKTYPDTTAALQAAIDRASGYPGGGTVLLGNGTYRVGRALFLDRDKVILRGESRENTVLELTGTQLRPGIVVGASPARQLKSSPLEVDHPDYPGGRYTLELWTPDSPSVQIGFRAVVSESYCPVGRYSVAVDNPSGFTVGCEVIIERPHNAAWIRDIGMDAIAGAKRQWSDQDMSMRWMRRVTAIEGNRVTFDAPLVQALDAAYGGGYVLGYALDRCRSCGLEQLTLESEYDPSQTAYDENTASILPSDEKHAWYGVVVNAAEDCWICGVTVRNVGFAAVQLFGNARCISVEDCSFVHPVSYPGGARRYGFALNGSHQCLFKNCYAEQAAMGFATVAKGGGPNVFTGCRGENMRTGAGPHLLWGTGTLYDCCSNSAGFRCTDHANSGSGHGWIGANTVFWNVETKGKLECESPWAEENTKNWDEGSPDPIEFASPHPSGRNYCIGLSGGERVKYKQNYNDQYVDWGYRHRPHPMMYPFVPYGAGGTGHVSLPCAEAAEQCDWWPRFALSAFTHPLSLYQCQLEDRHAR